MAATGKVPVHPSQYSPEVIEALRTFIRPGSRVHDPYAGTGVRLGKLCDELQCKFSGTDIERWSVMDRRIKVADANDGRYYPKTAFTVVTSPVYLNKRMGDYAEGPLETTNVRGRRDYGISPAPQQPGPVHGQAEAGRRLLVRARAAYSVVG